MSAQPQPSRWSLEAYLAFEAGAPVRHELVAGQVFAMAGASVNHNLIAGQSYAALLPRARAHGCQVFMESVKLHVRHWDSDYVFYPDLMVCCDPDDNDPMIRRSPCVIIEVLSESTRATDRREKLDHYSRIESLQAYVLLDQESVCATVHRRRNQWAAETHTDRDSEIALDCKDLVLRLADSYAGLQLRSAK